MYKVLIIMCSFNGEEYIGQQIESIMQQDYEDFMLRIIDDGSSDNTINIVEDYIKKYPQRIEIICRDLPTGSACANFLQSINEARNTEAEYYMLSDQDDVWLPGKMSEMVRDIQTEEQKLCSNIPILVHSDVMVADEKLNVISNSRARYIGGKYNNLSMGELLIDNRVVGGSVIFNKALIDKLYTMPKSAIMHDYWLAMCALGLGRLCYVDKPLYYYRRHTGNVSYLKKSGISRQLLNRLGFGEKDSKQMNTVISEEYDRKVKQAKEFLEIYSKELSEKDKKTIDAFCKFRPSGILKRGYLTVRHRLFYTSKARTIGECVLMPRDSY